MGALLGAGACSTKKALPSTEASLAIRVLLGMEVDLALGVLLNFLFVYPFFFVLLSLVYELTYDWFCASWLAARVGLCHCVRISSVS